MAMSGSSVSFFHFLSEIGMSHILDYEVLWSILTHRACWNTDAAVFPKLPLETQPGDFIREQNLWGTD